MNAKTATSLELPLDTDQATKFLDEHDLHDVLNKLPDEAFDLLTGMFLAVDCYCKLSKVDQCSLSSVSLSLGFLCNLFSDYYVLVVDDQMIASKMNFIELSVEIFVVNSV